MKRGWVQPRAGLLRARSFLQKWSIFHLTGNITSMWESGKALRGVAALATREEPPGGTKTRPTPRGVGSFLLHQGVPLSWPVQQPRAGLLHQPRERNTLAASAATPRTAVRNRDAHQKRTECAAGTTGNRATRPRIKTACFIRSSWCLIMGSRTCTPRRHVSTSCSTRVLSQRRYRPHTAR